MILHGIVSRFSSKRCDSSNVSGANEAVFILNTFAAGLVLPLTLW